jgi:hypothetical protein
MIANCKNCGNAYKTTETAENVHPDLADPNNRLCPDCYKFYYKSGVLPQPNECRRCNPTCRGDCEECEKETGDWEDELFVR